MAIFRYETKTSKEGFMIIPLFAIRLKVMQPHTQLALLLLCLGWAQLGFPAVSLTNTRQTFSQLWSVPPTDSVFSPF